MPILDAAVAAASYVADLVRGDQPAPPDPTANVVLRGPCPRCGRVCTWHGIPDPTNCNTRYRFDGACGCRATRW